jgi:hypothetical protein
MSEPNYKPGDVANGHILTDGGQWVPVRQWAQPAERQPTTKPPFFQRKWVQITGTALLSLFIGIGMGSSAPQTTVTETVPATAEQQKQLEEDSAALAQREAEFGQRSAALDGRQAELDQREAALKPQEEAAKRNAVGDGVWVVGQDIDPGTYRTRETTRSDCYWEIDKSGTNGSDIIENDRPGGGYPQVNLSEGQDFKTSDCGEWIKQ